MEKNNNGQRVAYIRVSSADQNQERQEAIGQEADKVFREKASAGEGKKRPELRNAIDWVRKGDTLTVWSIDRLARSIVDLNAIAAELREKGVVLHFVSENLTFDPNVEADPFAEAMFNMVGIFAQFERRISKQRQREGIAAAKLAKKYRGQKPSLTAEQVAEIRKRVKEKAPKAEIARELKVDRTTIYRALKPDYVTREEWEELAGGKK